MASDIPANNVHCTGVVYRYTHFLQPLRVNFTRTLRVFFTRTLCVFFYTRVLRVYFAWKLRAIWHLYTHETRV